MKKVIVLLTLAFLIVAGYIIMRTTYTLTWYKIVSTSSIPTYEPGKLVFASRWKEPEKGNFICYKQDKQIWIFRCVGKGGDVVEMKDSEVYVNGKKLNENYITHEYLVTEAESKSVQMYLLKSGENIHVDNQGYLHANLSESIMKQLNVAHPRQYINTKGQFNPRLYPAFANAGYNEDNFGPVKVPANSYFVLGDNRHDAYDSRYTGFVPANNVVATVLN